MPKEKLEDNNPAPPNPYATDEEEAALAALEQEIAQSEESLESDFADFAASRVDEKLEELFFEDKKAFFQAILKMQNEFLQNLRDKQSQANNLRGDIAMKKSFASIEEAGAAFEAAHPEVSVDVLLDFYANDLSPRVKTQLDKLEPQAFFEALFSEWQKAQGGTQEQEKLPQQLNGNNQELNNTNETLVTDRY